MKRLLLILALLAISYADIQSDSLALHNNERNAYGVPSVTWSASLAASAQAYAQTMASTGTTSHSTNRNNVGENLAWGSGSSISVTSLGNLWIKEKQYFIPGTDFPDCSTTGSWHDVAHYTQLMWEKTTEIGCGIAQGSSGRSSYVCHYSPQGNMNGQSVYTVGSSSSSSSPSTSSSAPSSGNNQGSTTTTPVTTPVTTTPVTTEPVTTTPQSNDNQNNHSHNNNNHHHHHHNDDNNNNDNNNNNDDSDNNDNSNHNNNNDNNNNSDNNNNNNDNAGSSSSSSPSSTTPTTSQPTTTPSQPSSSSSSSAPASTSAPDASSSQFVTDSLNAHNNERNNYGVPSLTWSADLAASAQAYAETMAQTGTTSHSTGRVNVGENLAWGSGKSITTTHLIGLWIDEKQYFIPGTDFPDCSTTGSWHDVAHYTAMMWRQTTEVGCGIAQAGSGRYNLVCHYSPRGNMDGEPVY